MGSQPAVQTEQILDANGGVIRSIAQVYDASGNLIGYNVTVHSYSYGFMDVQTAAQTGSTSENQLVSETDYLPFFLAGADAGGLRYSQAPVQIASQKNWNIVDTDTNSNQSGNWGQVSSQSTLLANGTLAGTTFGDYFDGKPMTIVDSQGNVTVNTHDGNGNITSTTTRSGTSLALTTNFTYTDGSHGVPAGLLYQTDRVRNGVADQRNRHQ